MIHINGREALNMKKGFKNKQKIAGLVLAIIFTIAIPSTVTLGGNYAPTGYEDTPTEAEGMSATAEPSATTASAATTAPAATTMP